jgi:hypothetical protein
MCCSSSWHGCSQYLLSFLGCRWDRQPYLTKAVNPDKLSADAIMSHVNNNFFICSYGAVKGIDHDDGSGVCLCTPLDVFPTNRPLSATPPHNST